MRLFYISALALAMSSFTQAQAATAQEQAATLCNGEVMPQVNLICAPDHGIEPNDTEDSTAKFAALFTAHQGKGVFLPSGVYIINSDVHVKSGNSIIGSADGHTILRSTDAQKSPIVGEVEYGLAVSDVSMKHLVLDNVAVKFYGNKKNINVSENIFINTKEQVYQLSVARFPSTVENNLFLRDAEHPGVGLLTYGANKPLISHNYFGDISPESRNKVAVLLSQPVNNLLEKIDYLGSTGQLSVSDDQSYFKTAWASSSGMTDAVFKKNVIIGNKKLCLKYNDSKCEMERDHGLYIQRYKNVEVVQNYFSGWPNTAAGHLKFRNASQLYFVGNYLDDTDFMARPYTYSEVRTMDNTFIFNNYFHKGSMSYWQEKADTDEVFIDATNYAVFSNYFSTEEKPKSRIHVGKDSTHSTFMMANNVDQQGNEVMSENFTQVDEQDILSLLPTDKRHLLDIEPILRD
ncbi:glycosyl hydrolase family 28-related protein [Yersinia hibernica]|uniref:Pectate lyase superfamily protein domain-containing protein n=1 Tax=Yersinia enterocolitica LC20 TaxID=1443113 RepID=A0A7U4K1Q2_YEREN|nr:glycosyl hydrolase family 28-related protein [Yersinia hibernica]AHM74782.1 hypothetical protein LC20_03529 [Yersinia hibernica]OVZ92772.1 hypothetical protein CBW54_03380 [Yersinia kristensenii]